MFHLYKLPLWTALNCNLACSIFSRFLTWFLSIHINLSAKWCTNLHLEAAAMTFYEGNAYKGKHHLSQKLEIRCPREGYVFLEDEEKFCSSFHSIFILAQNDFPFIPANVTNCLNALLHLASAQTRIPFLSRRHPLPGSCRRAAGQGFQATPMS